MEFNGQRHAPAALNPQKGLRYLLSMRVGGPQRGSKSFGGDKSLAPAGNRTTNP